MDSLAAAARWESEKNQKAAQAQKQNETQKILENYGSNPSGGFSLYGTDEEKGHQAANLSQVGAQTGQNLFQTGAQSQDYINSLQERRAGKDAASKFMMDSRNRNMANTARSFAGRGVSGGVAAAGMNSAQASADSNIAKEMQGFQTANDKELFNWVKRQQKVEGGALAAGSDRGLANEMSIDTGTGIMGTVICTELFRQGLMDKETYAKDAIFGHFLSLRHPEVVRGYRYLAAPVVRGMQKSKWFTRLISFPALAWARYMAHGDSLFGATVMALGMPICYLAGLALPEEKAYA